MPLPHHQKVICLGLVGSLFILLIGLGQTHSLLSFFPLVGAMICFSTVGLHASLFQIKALAIGSLGLFLLTTLGGEALERLFEPFFKMALLSLLLAFIVKKKYAPLPWAALGFGFLTCLISIGSILGALPQLEAAFQQAFPGTVPAHSITIFLSLLPFFNGLTFIFFSVLCLSGAASLSRRVLGSTYALPPFLSLPSLPLWYYWVTVAALSGSLLPFAPIPCLNIAFFSFVPFFLVGIETLHMCLKRLPSPKIGFVLFYTLFFIAALPFSVLTSGIGLLEPWLKIKERLKPSNQE